MFEALTILAGLLLLGWALWEQKQFTGGARKLRERSTFSAWCFWGMLGTRALSSRWVRRF